MLKQGTKESEICVLAFTNKAAEEFAERLKQAELDSEKMFVGTFSSWCNKLLKINDDQPILNAEAASKVIETLTKPKSKIAKATRLMILAAVVRRSLITWLTLMSLFLVAVS